MVLSAGNSKAAWGPGDESLFIGLLVRVDKLGGARVRLTILAMRTRSSCDLFPVQPQFSGSSTMMTLELS